MATSQRRRMQQQARKRARRQARRAGGPAATGPREQGGHRGPSAGATAAADPGTFLGGGGGEHVDWGARVSVALLTTMHDVRSRRRRLRVPEVELRVLSCRLRGAPPDVVDRELRALTAGLRRQVREGGWSDEELEQATARRLGDDHVPALRGEDRSGELDDRLRRGLSLCVLLSELPLQQLPPTAPRHAPVVDPEVSRRLATVRALLAKAERTDFEAEAEALSAKAQAMIAKFSLDRLLRDHDRGAEGSSLAVSRIWLDPPYVMPKAMLVGAVARANRCRAAVSDVIGLCTVLGHRDDLDYTELLVTSLLVQASRAMLHHGSQTDTWGGSRTRSFRQSFLVAFATRIGERLQEATAQAEVQAGAGGAGTSVAVVVRDHEARVEEEFAQRFATRAAAGPAATDARGWRAGTAAADLAALDVHDHVERG